MVYLGLHSVQFREISIFDEFPALGGIYSQALLILGIYVEYKLEEYIK